MNAQRPLALVLVLAVLLALLPTSALGAENLNIRDASASYPAYLSNFGLAYDLDGSDTDRVTVDVATPEGGATVLLFFRGDDTCQRTNGFMDTLRQTEWGRSDKVNMVAVETTNAARDMIRGYIDAHQVSGILDRIYYDSNLAGWYLQLVENNGNMDGVDSLQFGITFVHAMVLTQGADGSYVRYSQGGLDSAQALTPILEALVDFSVSVPSPAPPTDVPDIQQPSAAPDVQPTATPGAEPTATPGAQPTDTPDAEPTATPGAQPTATPDTQPTDTPGAQPTATPGTQPTATPGTQPSSAPAVRPGHTGAGQSVLASFWDVVPGSWYAPGVAFVVGRGLFQGVAPGQFAPERNMTRAMLTTVLARLAGQNTVGGATWYEKGMEWAVAQGISDGTAPERDVTREQMVTMLYRYAKAAAVEGELSAFVDGDSVSPWAREAMIWAVSRGVITGKDGRRLDPQGTATRAEVATILQRFVEQA